MNSNSTIETINSIVGSDSYFQLAFETWLVTCPRFLQFLEEYDSKIRKKVREATDEDRKKDLVAELHIAWLILKQPGMEVKYEPWGNKEAAPDFMVTENSHSWCIEVKHLRDISQPLDLEADEVVLPEIPSNENRLRNIVTRSLRQWRNDMPTLLWINTQCGNTDIVELTEVLFKLSQSNTLEDLSGAFILSTWPSSTVNMRSLLRVNQNAKLELSYDAIKFLLYVEKLDKIYGNN